MSKTYKEFMQLSEVVTDKNRAINDFTAYAVNKLQSMFEYKGLPDSIPAKWLEYYLMCNGNAFIAEHDSKLYAFIGGLGGVPDAYYQPTIYTVSNPYLNLTRDFRIDKDGVLIRNDSVMMGLLPIIRKYGTLLTEADLTTRLALINLRTYNLISASDDNTKKSADEYIKKVENGETAIIGESPFFDGVKLHNNNNSANYLTQIIEMTQYLKASFYNEIGLNANYNLKREYISTSENTLADDILLPFCDNMLTERKQGIEKINAMFGTNITVDFSSVWKTNSSQNEKELAENETAANTPDDITADPENTPDDITADPENGGEE